jgi:hypothetical protein
VITLAATTRIAAPPSAVIAFIAFREVMNAGGKRVEATCEIVELDADRRYAWQSVSGGPTTYGGGFTQRRSRVEPNCATKTGQPHRGRSSVESMRGPAKHSVRQKLSSRPSNRFWSRRHP